MVLDMLESTSATRTVYWQVYASRWEWQLSQRQGLPPYMILAPSNCLWAFYELGLAS